MAGSHLLRPLRADGTQLDATFEISMTSIYELVFHHKAGARGSPRAVNSDYHEALETLLGRLSTIGCSILAISVDSAVALQLAPEERELDLDYPIVLNESTDLKAVRLRIT